MTDLVTPFQPVTLKANGTSVSFGVAPAGCQISSAALPALSEWELELPGSYVVRVATDRRPEWWRVRCSGPVRYEGPADTDAGYPVTYDPATDPVRGTVNVGLARSALFAAAREWGYEVAGAPKMVWGGTITGTERFDGYAVVLAAPAIGDGWAGEVRLASAKDGMASVRRFAVPFDPTVSAPTLAIPLDTGPSGTVLVVTPPATSQVRSVHDGREVARATVAAGAALLRLPGPPDPVVETIGPDGRPVDKAGLVAGYRAPALVNAWDE